MLDGMDALGITNLEGRFFLHIAPDVYDAYAAIAL
jgi:hypothetical protein